MRKVARAKRDRMLFLYRYGLEGELPHTLFECALHFDLSINQVFLNLKKFKEQLLSTAFTDGVPFAAQKFGVSTQTVERFIR